MHECWRLTIMLWRLQMARSPCNLSSPGFAAMLSAAVNSSSMREGAQHSAEQAREALQDTLRGLPANKQIDLRVLKEAYDSSIREACAADAAVAAVAKVCPRVRSGTLCAHAPSSEASQGRVQNHALAHAARCLHSAGSNTNAACYRCL